MSHPDDLFRTAEEIPAILARHHLNPRVKHNRAKQCRDLAESVSILWILSAQTDSGFAPSNFVAGRPFPSATAEPPKVNFTG
jgi:hypothetical protein